MFSLRTSTCMPSIRSFFPVWGCSSPRFDKTSWPLYWVHDGLNCILWLLSQHSMMVSLRTVPSIFSVFNSSIRRVDHALWAAHWFHDSDKSYFARSLAISSLLFLRNKTNRATLRKVNLMRSEPRERIFEPHRRRIETRFPWVEWLLDMNKPTVKPCFLIWGAIDEIATPKPRSNHEFQNATDLTCMWFDTSNQYCIINSEETPVKAVMNKLMEGVCTNYHEKAKADLVAIHEVNRPSARSYLTSHFRQKQRDH